MPGSADITFFVERPRECTIERRRRNERGEFLPRKYTNGIDSSEGCLSRFSKMGERRNLRVIPHLNDPEAEGRNRSPRWSYIRYYEENPKLLNLNCCHQPEVTSEVRLRVHGNVAMRFSSILSEQAATTFDVSIYSHANS